MTAPFERERRVCRELFAGFIDAPLAAAHQAGEDQRLRLCPALRQALLDEELIGPPLGRRLIRNSGAGRLRGDLAAERGERHRRDVASVEPGLVVLRLR